jgi:DNA-binding response OmpR family regulator
MRVLVVEDYAPLRQALSSGLREAGFAVDTSEDGEDGEWHARSTAYDLIILDLMLPKREGSAVLQSLRRDGIMTPILVLTARDTVADTIAGLDRGADDYLAKPFDFGELLARVRSLTRRQTQSKTSLVTIADLSLDRATRIVQRGGMTILLTAKEFALLELLALRQGEVVTRSEIWEKIYDHASEAGSNVVDVYMGYLRKKIERADLPRLLHTRRGLGYVLSLDP